MATITRVIERTGETREEVLQRMAEKAIAEDVVVAKLAGSSDVYVALSTGNRGAYVVRPGVPTAGCTCQGYGQHGYCKHYALACIRHGLLKRAERKPEPNPEDKFKCRECRIVQDKPLNFGLCDECIEADLRNAGQLDHEFESWREAQGMYQDHWAAQIDLNS